MTIKELCNYCKNKNKAIVVRDGHLVGFISDIWC